MKHHRHFCVLSKILSVTLAATMLLGTIWTGTALAAETRVEGDYTYTVLDDGTAQITRYSGTASELTVPATLGGADVSSIGFRAFENNDDVKRVIFPDTLRTVGEYAFPAVTCSKRLIFRPVSPRLTNSPLSAVWRCNRSIFRPTSAPSAKRRSAAVRFSAPSPCTTD